MDKTPPPAPRQLNLMQAAAMKFFGPPEIVIGASLERDETPVGVRCSWCKIPIEADDAGFLVPTYGGEDWVLLPEHQDCFVRQLVGSVEHQKGECSCFHPERDYDTTVSTPAQRRAEATEAVEYFRSQPSPLTLNQHDKVSP